jgi:hypothetical protein
VIRHVGSREQAATGQAVMRTPSRSDGAGWRLPGVQSEATLSGPQSAARRQLLGLAKVLVVTRQVLHHGSTRNLAVMRREGLHNARVRPRGRPQC